jgi:hypothetical protein
VQHEWIGIGSEFGDDDGTRWAIRPAMKVMSRESRSSLATRTGHFALRAVVIASALVATVPLQLPERMIPGPDAFITQNQLAGPPWVSCR